MVKINTLLSVLLLFSCSNNQSSTFNRTIEDSSLKILVDKEIKRVTSLDCDNKETEFENKNRCFYNDAGFVILVDHIRTNICEESIYNSPPGCVASKTLYAYYDEYFESCSFIWNHSENDYIFAGSCEKFDRHYFESIINERLNNSARALDAEN